jgi:uncharacterized protein YbjT (DUF2867 family)
MKTALIIGATGLVGSHLLDLLTEDPGFDKIKVFTRKPTGKSNRKLGEFIVDFDDPGAWSGELKGDVLFSAMGTTLKKAGSKDAQYRIDFTYQYETAQRSAANGVPAYVLVSSAGADPKSMVFYSKMKGELEDAVSSLPFRSVRIIRPGILDGERNESRPMEKAGIGVARFLKGIPGLKKYRPIHARVVAQAMINATNDASAGTRKYELEEVFSLAAG